MGYILGKNTYVKVAERLVVIYTKVRVRDSIKNWVSSTNSTK